MRKYGLSALDEECAELAATPIGGGKWGGRNRGIYHAAMKLGSLVGAGALGLTVAKAALESVVRSMPHNDDLPGALETLQNGLDYGIAHPRDLSDIAEQARRRAASSSRFGAAPRSSSPTPSRRDEGLPSSRAGGESGDRSRKGSGAAWGDDLTRKCAHLPHTDLGNLERFLARFGEDFLYVEAWGWLAWEGSRWSRDMANALLGHAVQRTMRAIQAEAKFVRDSGWKRGEAPLALVGRERDDGLDYVAKYRGKEPVAFSTTIAAWGRTSEGAGHINCIAKLAEARLSARPDDFDADPLLLNVINGTIAFRRKDGDIDAAAELREHRREDRITKICRAAYDPVERSPQYDAFLEDVQPAADMRDFLDVWAGYNALGLADAQKMALFYGEGSNGKGVWINTQAYVLGDYAWSAAIETFIDQGKYRKGSDASPDLAALAGRRMVYANEPEEGSKFSDGLIKSMTSDEPIGGVRELLKPPFELQVTFTNTVSANNKPRIGTDHGIQRRMQVVPWEVIVTDNRVDPLLKTKLKAEASGILNRMVRGAVRYLSSGLPAPEAIKEATREYQAENDILGQFLLLAVERVEGNKIGASEYHRVFAGWQTWAQLLPASGKPWSPKYLNAQMQKKGFKISKSSTMQWQGIALRYDEIDFVDEQGRPVTHDLPAPRTIGPQPERPAFMGPEPPPPAPTTYGDDDDLPVF